MKRMMLLLFVTIMLCACSKENKDIENITNGEKYSIYSIQKNEFVTVDYYSETTDVSGLVKELLGQMGLITEEDAPKPDVYVDNCNVANGVAYVYFNSAYMKMDNIYEVLFRASVVKTLAQLEGVDYVYFYVSGKSLTYDNGQIVGLMSKEDFLTDSDRDLNSLAWTTLTLYFANSEGKALVEQQYDVAYDKTVSLEKVIFEQLIQGPEDENLKAVMPESVKLLGVTVNEGICYINLDSSFIKEKTEVPFEVTLYAIVNSLCELTNIHKVQFQINGDSHVEANGFSFDMLYERNLDLLEQEVVEN